MGKKSTVVARALGVTAALALTMTLAASPASAAVSTVNFGCRLINGQTVCR